MSTSDESENSMSSVSTNADSQSSSSGSVIATNSAANEKNNVVNSNYNNNNNRGPYKSRDLFGVQLEVSFADL